MNNPAIFRESENAVTGYNRNKLLTTEEKLPKVKNKVLGEVQNTLHSRPGNFATPNWAPSAKARVKPSGQVKETTNHGLVSAKNITSQNQQFLTPQNATDELPLTSSSIEADIQEIHNHFLCEQSENSHFNDYFTQYKFSDEQVQNLVQSVKISSTSISTEACEPCEDILVPEDKPEEKGFSFDDILSNLTVPEVPVLMMFCSIL